MAIVINDLKVPISPEEGRDILQRNTDNFGVFFDVDRCYELSAILQLEMLDILRSLRRISLNPKLDLNDKNSIVETLVKMGVNKSEFYDDSRKLSFTEDIRKAILDNPKYNEDIHTFVSGCSTFVSNKRNKGNVENFANKNPRSKALSKRNHRMSIGRPTWSILNTKRLGASDPGIQGIPRTMGDIVCEPKGYTLIRCDSAQIEPKINFSAFIKDKLIVNLIMYYKDAYYGILHYCKMSDEEEALCRNNFDENFKPIEITDDIADMRQVIKRLTNAGSYGSSNLAGINPQLASLYEKRVVKHPNRLALETKVRSDVGRGIDTFYSYFGTPVTPDETEKYTKGGKGWKEHVIRCGINNPIQTTASDLMMFSINEANKILSKAKDSHICFYKHDEACFYVSDDDMANGIGDMLSDITAYNVKDWIPIESDPLIGVKEGSYPSYIL